MGLPTLVKTWEFKPNFAVTATGTVLTTNRTILKAIKDALISNSDWVDNANASTTPSNMWTTRYSCDSVAAGAAGDGVDRWDSITDLVWANAGSAHSWYVFRQTTIDTNFEFLISCESSSASGSILTLVISPSAAFTGGSTTARPTATDEIVILSASSWGGSSSVDANVKIHVMKSSDGECWRIFTANGGHINGAWFIEKAVSFLGASWTHQGVGFCQGGSAANNVITQSALTSSFNFNARGASSMTMLMASMGSNAGLLGTLITTVNDLSLNWPFLPHVLYSATVANKGVHGYLNDVWFGSTTTASGSTAPTSGTQHQFVQLGSLIFPWCQTAISMS